MKVNYKSDFKITEVLKDSLVGIPFTFIYKVENTTVKEVSFDGENYQDCELAEGKTNVIQVVFDNDGFPCGQMTCHRVFNIPDASYKDGVRHMEFEDMINVVLVKGNGDKELNLTNYLVPSFLKPIKGTDYWTEEDQASIISSAKTLIVSDNAFVTELQGKVNSDDFKSTLESQTAKLLEADNEFNDDIRTKAINVLKVDAGFRSAISAAVSTVLESDENFNDTVKNSVKAALSTDAELAAAIESLIDTGVFRSAIASSVGTSLKNDKDFKSAIESSTATDLQADETFETAVSEKVAALLKSDDAFKSTLQSSLTEALKSDNNFIMAVNKVILDDVISGLNTDATFIAKVQEGVNTEAFQTTLKTETAATLATDADFIAAVKAAIEAGNLGE